MKKIILIITLSFFVILSYGQDEKNQDVFITDSTWTKEIIEFPINFAREIKYEGFEDLRFPQGWAKQDNPEFWSYVWAWNINDIQVLTENDLEKNIQLYFDGLLGLDFFKLDDVKVPKSNAVFIKKENLNGNTQFVGKIKTFDSRFTKLPMTLFVRVESHYCKYQKKSIFVFRYSPKPFDHSIWKKLDEVKLRDNYCE